MTVFHYILQQQTNSISVRICSYFSVIAWRRVHQWYVTSTSHNLQGSHGQTFKWVGGGRGGLFKTRVDRRGVPFPRRALHPGLCHAPLTPYCPPPSYLYSSSLGHLGLGQLCRPKLNRPPCCRPVDSGTTAINGAFTVSEGFTTLYVYVLINISPRFITSGEAILS